MDYKEKYNAALRRAKKLYGEGTITECLGWVFPELEDEDERIKREILELVSISSNGNQFEEIKDWLEKQGRMLDPDKVIEWLRKNTCAACWDNPNEGVSQRIEQFKKDFEL